MHEKFHVSEEDWDAEILEITAEHDQDGARQQLIDGWKSWIQALHAEVGELEGGAAMARVNMSMVIADE